MPRSIWNGALNFGLVNVPVALFSATEHLAAIRPSGNMPALETMFFPDEVRSPDEIENLPKDEAGRS